LTIVEREWNDRRYWVYVPAQYRSSVPASLMVFQDGWLYLDPEGEIRAGLVFDDLIDRGEMPVTVGVFVDPEDDRNAEYDTFSDAYATFLLTEILPEVRDAYGITDDPEQWAIGGSSGGSCAFTVAWLRPDRFRRVFSSLGSFAQIPGGNPYPELIENTPPKPLRTFLHAAMHDLNRGPGRNWLSENLRVAVALSDRGYDFRLVVGEGGHELSHTGSILPDALRWLWRR